jgi:hypothetical protein
MPAQPQSGRDSIGVRVGNPGEYTSPFMATEQARYQFLQAVRRLCPRPLWYLRKRIFPFYSRWVDDFMHSARADEQWEQSPEGATMVQEMVDFFKRQGMTDAAAQIAAKGRPVAGLGGDDPVFHTFMLLEDHNPRLARLLMRWAQRNGLTHQRQFEEALQPLEERIIEAEEGTVTLESLSEMTLHKDYWACEWALCTLWSWKFSPDGAQMLIANPPEWVRMTEDQSLASEEPAFCIRPGWDVLTETEPAYRDRVERTLTSYIERNRHLAKARGLVETPKKRQRRHFDWLALYQVKRWGYARIADWNQEQPRADTHSEDVIRKGVRSAADLCKLPARPGKPGRPTIRKT